MERIRRLVGGPEARLIGLTFAVKVAVLVIGALAYLVLIGPLHDPLGIWNRWDAPHYLDIADWGYMATDPGVAPTYSQRYDLDLFIVFYPLYPWLVRAAGAVIADTHFAGLAVSTVAGLAVAPLLYRLTLREYPQSIAFRSAWYLLIFPTAFFLHIAYTEALFLALILGSFLAARGDRWWLAGLLGGLAALTRVNGLILVAALGVEAWLQWRGDRQLRLRWLWILLIPVGFGIYLLVNNQVYGTPFAFADILREHWYKYPAPPWSGITDVVHRALNFSDPAGALWYGWMELLFVAIGLGASIAALIWMRSSWAVWMAGNWLLFTSTSFILSVPRYTLTMFPLMVGMALLSRQRWQVVAISVASFGLLTFFAGRFAIGQWAF